MLELFLDRTWWQLLGWFAFGLTALVHWWLERGYRLVVDDRGVRQRTGWSGWIEVRWSQLQEMGWDDRKGHLVLRAPGGVWRDGRLLPVEEHRIKDLGHLRTSRTRLVAYLHHRWQRAQQLDADD